MIALVMLAASAQDSLPQEPGPCDAAAGPLAVGPAAVSLWDGALGAARRACPRTEVGLAPRALLLVDTPAFYGQIVALAAIDGSIAFGGDRSEVFVHFEPVRYQNVISAIPSDFLGYGFTAIGMTRRIDDDGPVAVAVGGRAVLPTAIGLYGHSWPLGLDLSVIGERSVGPWSAHAQLAYLGSGAFSKGPTQIRTGFSSTLGGIWRPSGGFSAVLDVQAALGTTDVLDHLAVAPALRVGGGATGVELAAAFPFAGRERALAVVELHVVWRL